VIIIGRRHHSRAARIFLRLELYPIDISSFIFQNRLLGSSYTLVYFQLIVSRGCAAAAGGCWVHSTFITARMNGIRHTATAAQSLGIMEGSSIQARVAYLVIG
jgi:hypothetical protein